MQNLPIASRRFGPRTALLLCLGTIALACSAQQPTKTAAAPPVELEADRVAALVTHGDCLLRNGTVITVSRGTLANGDVLIRKGKIAEVGHNLAAPPGVTVIDVTGRFVTPGIIDAHSHIASDATNEGTDSITAEVRIKDVLNPESISLWRGLSNGVTTSLVLHGSANAIGGQSSVVKMKYRRSVEEMLIPDAPRMIKFALGENVKRSGRSGGGSTRYPTTRMGVETVYRRAFAEARAYMAAWARYEKERERDPNAVPPRRDLRLEALSDVLKQKIWVQCHCYRADEMLMMVRLSQEFGFKIGALQHALEAYKIAPELAEAHIPVSTFADAWAYKVEAFDAVPFNAAVCVRAGIVTSVNSDNGAGAYRLNLEAAKAMKFGGLTEEEAWKLITVNPAKQLGIDHRTGTLEPGKDADVTVWQGHPFTVSSKCAMTLVDGEVFFQRRDAYGVDKGAFTRTSVAGDAATQHTFGIVPAAQTVAIVGATIHPLVGPVLTNGTLVISGSKIAAIGSHVNVPRGAAIVHAKGLHVYPGMIDCGSTLGLEEVEAIAATIDSSESGLFQPDLRALTAVNAASEHIAVTRCDGVTSALTRPQAGGGFGGGGSVISGQGAMIVLDGWTPEQMRISSPSTLHISFPEGSHSLRSLRRILAPAFLQRQAALEKEEVRKLREFVDRARRYHAAAVQAPETTVPDPQLEAMAPYLDGKLPVIFSAATAYGIRQALNFASEYKLKAVVETGPEALQVIDLLAQKQTPVIYRLPMQNSLESSAPPHEYDPYDAVFAAPGLLRRAGIKVCFASTGAPESKNLPSQVGITRGFGLSEDDALRSLTIDAATILGVADRLGSLEPGKLANVIVTDGDPLEITTHVRGLFILGHSVPLENRHTRLYERYLERLGPTRGGSAAAARPHASPAGAL